MSSLKKTLKKKGYVRISLTLTQTNHFEVAASINGISGRFILDTGASNTCVGIDKVALFGLSTKESPIKAAGAGAVDMETQLATKNTVQIASWTKKKVKLVVFDLQHVNEALTSHNALPVDGIIGADLLRKGKAVIDYDHRVVFLK